MPRSPRPLAAAVRLLRRSPARAAALAGGVLVLAAVAFAETPAYQARLDALAKASAAARQRAGLIGSAACVEDPTPEMTFATLLPVKAGATFTVEAQGHFSKGTHFVFRSDHVHVVSARLKASGATITGRVDPGTVPGVVSLFAVGPLCPAQISFDAVKVEAATEWDLKLDNGWTCRLVAGGIGEDRHDCKATFTAGGRTRTLPCVLTQNGDGSFRAELGTPQDIQARAMKQMATLQDPQVVKAQTAAQNAISEMDKCQKEHDQARQLACIQAVSKKVTALQAKVSAAQEAALKRAMKDAFGCLSLDLSPTGHKVSVAAICFNYPDKHEGQGTVTVK